jgi:hypothetical protein
MPSTGVVRYLLALPRSPYSVVSRHGLGLCDTGASTSIYTLHTYIQLHASRGATGPTFAAQRTGHFRYGAAIAKEFLHYAPTIEPLTRFH